MTNLVLETIHARTGVTSYTKEIPSRELLEMIVKAGIAAPSAYNRQSWHFSVVTNPELLEALDRMTFHGLDSIGDIAEDERDYKPLYDAPALIILSSSEDNEYAQMDCACANQNMAIAAKSLGLSSRFLDVPNIPFQGNKNLGKMYGVPEGYKTVCFLVVGYGKEIEQTPSPRNHNVVTYLE